MKNVKMSDDEKEKRRKALDKKETDLMRLRRMRLSIKSFEPITMIGRGAFGEVFDHNCNYRMFDHWIYSS